MSRKSRAQRFWRLDNIVQYGVPRHGRHQRREHYHRLLFPNMMGVRGALVKWNYKGTMRDEMLRFFVAKTINGHEE